MMQWSFQELKYEDDKERMERGKDIISSFTLKINLEFHKFFSPCSLRAKSEAFCWFESSKTNLKRKEDESYDLKRFKASFSVHVYSSLVFGVSEISFSLLWLNVCTSLLINTFESTILHLKVPFLSIDVIKFPQKILKFVQVWISIAWVSFKPFLG